MADKDEVGGKILNFHLDITSTKMKGILSHIALFFFSSYVIGPECKCIDNSFSKENSNPIAFSQIDKIQVAFCGYSYEDIGVLKQNSSFIGSGYEIILCIEKKSIFEVGEYFKDSIVIRKNEFEIFRIEEFPTGNNEEYSPIPILKFTFSNKGDEIHIDTTLSVPLYYTSTEYFIKLESQIQSSKNDEENPTKYPDLNLHYLFLKAVSDKKYETDFIKSGPYDGYLGVVYNNFTDYLRFKRE